MIADRIENWRLYAGLSDGISKAFEILMDGGTALKKDGRYEVQGDRLYYNVQHYKTRAIEESKFEAHEKYIDVQFVVEGKELIGVARKDKLKISQAYDSDKDVAFYKVPAEFSSVIMKAGMFCVLFPHDAHMPCVQAGEPADVHKVVVKIKING